MSACSAACTAPMIRAGSTPAPISTSSGTVYQHARVVSSRGGKSRGTTSNTSLVDVRRRWYATRSWRTVTAPRCASPCADRHRPLRRDDRDVGLLARLGVLVGVVGGLEHRDLVLGVEVAHPVLTALVQVDRTGVGDVEHARRVDRAHESSVGVDQLELERRPGAQPDPRARVARGRPSTSGRRGA